MSGQFATLSTRHGLVRGAAGNNLPPLPPGEGLGGEGEGKTFKILSQPLTPGPSPERRGEEKACRSALARIGRRQRERVAGGKSGDAIFQNAPTVGENFIADLASRNILDHACACGPSR